MGVLKNWQMEQDQRGFRWVADAFVCGKCVDDYALQAHIRANATATTCSYCGSSADEPIACELDTFMECLAAGIAVDWDDAENFMPYDGGDWAFPDANLQIYDLLADGHLGIDVHEGLFEDIVEAFQDRAFAPRYFFGTSRAEQLSFGWDAFVKTVTHEVRFLFMAVGDSETEYGDPSAILPATMLSEIGQVVLDGGLIGTIAADTDLFRALPATKSNGDPRPLTAKQLGTPPLEHATTSNRMSPNGIPMFYGSFETETAQDESIAANPQVGELALATFATQVELTVVDLTTLPSVPSLFDEAARATRPSLIFLHHFAAEVSKPVARDKKEHIEYVPTQIVTEYFRHIFEREHGIRIDGLVYSSAARNGGRSLVLFVENADCVEMSEREAGSDGKLSMTKATVVIARHEVSETGGSRPAG
jgi:hypothetical protein